ncbi:ArsC family reductase [Altererythrobacter luteolus]|uniref:ArsC family reductase n=1 Tax=Pontixanthobacter luteolus TaxID=295089 RepID=A0A6I4V2N0_9SPHN|nr:ArsC family reductase [Pontixanthobacter luteolus]MXP48183.1 ArsC family reductase [Pontixanthobacter luteolus]
MIKMYGIPNCDTVKKARKWLEANNVDYAFHDYKKEGADPDRLARWADQAGWEVLLNKRGTTFRKLDDADKQDIDLTKAVELMAEHPSMIKRPVAEYDADTNGGAGLLVGFKEDEWSAVFS